MTNERMNKIIANVNEMGIRAEYKKMVKNNMKVDAIILGKGQVRPTVYFDSFDECLSDDEIARKICNIYEFCENENEIDFNMKNVFKLHNVFGVLVNTEMNIDTISTCPHRNLCDLSVIYRMNVSTNTDSKASFIITNNHIRELGWTEEMLFNAAMENMDTPIYKPLLGELANITEDDLELFEEDNRMYIITNKEKLYGVFGSMFDTYALRFISHKLNDDLCIIPSSIHEILVIPMKDTQNVKFMREMVRSVNDSQLKRQEILSYNVYKFDKATQEITIW